MTEREQTERALIGCVLEQPDLVDELSAEWFDDLRLGSLLITVGSMKTSGKSVDINTVAHASGNPELFVLLRECQEQCVTAINFPYWLEIISEYAEKSRLKRAADKFLRLLPSANGNLKSCIAELEGALSKIAPTEKRTLGNKECAACLSNHLEQRMELDGALSGIATGFCDLDAMIDGLQFGEYTVLASRPSVGKTAIACNIVERVCLWNKIPTLFLSLEMSAAALCRRMLSASQKILMRDLKSGRFTQGDFVKFAAFDALLKASPLYIRESFGGMAASEAASIIRRAAKHAKVKFAVLDYMQKLRPDTKHEKRTYEVAESSASLVAAVKESGVAFLCLAQLNRESERDKGRRPRLSDLADSSQIERDADNVLLLHRDRNDSEKPAELIVAKQRDGETGAIKLPFDGRYCRFGSASQQWQEDQT